MSSEPRALGKPYDDSADQPIPGMPEVPLAERIAAAETGMRNATPPGGCDEPAVHDEHEWLEGGALRRQCPGVRAAPIEAAHAVFSRWLGDEYDLIALDAVLAAAAVEQLDGDPVWLLLVSGSGNAKTETVAALAGARATVTSTITSEGALLSASSSKEKVKDSTGGLLRKMGARGVLVIKDVTSILSMNRDLRTSVLAALREVYDGHWERNVGTDGGRTLTWTGRLALIGAVTTAYDTAHSVIAAMGDRFALVRMDSTTGRVAAGMQALRNVGHEIEMRRDLAATVGEVLAGVDVDAATLDEADMFTLLDAADLVTLARTAVERDYRGDPIEAHAPEMPTRFAKMLGQIIRGARAVGIDHERARGIALRVARDSIPPLRAAILQDIAEHPGSPCRDVVKRVQRPRTTTDRALQELHLIGLLRVQAAPPEGSGWLSQDGAWRYELAPDISPALIKSLMSCGEHVEPVIPVEPEQLSIL